MIAEKVTKRSYVLRSILSRRCNVLNGRASEMDGAGIASKSLQESRHTMLHGKAESIRS